MNLKKVANVACGTGVALVGLTVASPLTASATSTRFCALRRPERRRSRSGGRHGGRQQCRWGHGKPGPWLHLHADIGQ